MKRACKTCAQEHEHDASSIRPLKNKLFTYEKNSILYPILCVVFV
jgi:hypothetical protein